jgi:hypothetical protein
MKPSEVRLRAYEMVGTYVAITLVMAYAMLVPIPFYGKVLFVAGLSVIVHVVLTSVGSVGFLLDQRASKAWLDTLTTRNAMDQMTTRRSIDWKQAASEAVDDIKSYNSTENFTDFVGNSKTTEFVIWLVTMPLNFIFFPALGWAISYGVDRYLPRVATFLIEGT